MTRLVDRRAILGIDPAKRGLAFVFFERGSLVDWGTRGRGGAGLVVFDRVLEVCPAEVVVLEDPAAQGCERRPRMRKLLRELARAAGRRDLEVVSVSRREVRRTWAARGLTRKQAVAAAIADEFPSLDVVIPKTRKTYMDEEARVQIFDAASLVLHAFPATDHGW